MKNFRNYNPEQLILLPPAIQDWLPKTHLALFISNVIEELDLSEFYDAYDGSKGGQPPYHPLMMVKLIVYAYSIGITSSRQIENATWENVAFRVLAAGEHPDHSVLAEFRKRHLTHLSNLFVQVLHLASKANLVDLNLVAIDGSKVKANADRNKSLSLESVSKREDKIKSRVAEILAEAENTDREEDEKYGERSIRQLPKELESKEAQLKLIRELKAKMEQEKKEREEAEAKEKAQKEAQRKPGSKKPGRAAKQEGSPKPETLVRNQTDYDSRVMRVPGGNWEQAYNAQLAVDSKAQIIVAADVTNEGNDSRQLEPMLHLTRQNTGRYPKVAAADTGYFNGKAIGKREFKEINMLVPPQKMKKERAYTRGKWAFPPADAMREKLNISANKSLYAKRKTVVEPVFGQIKSAKQKFREFSFRGLEKVKREWTLICLTHNLMKLFGAKLSPA